MVSDSHTEGSQSFAAAVLSITSVTAAIGALDTYPPLRFSPEAGEAGPVSISSTRWHHRTADGPFALPAPSHSAPAWGSPLAPGISKGRALCHLPLLSPLPQGLPPSWAAWTQMNVHPGTQGLELSKFVLHIYLPNGSHRARPENLHRKCLMDPSGSNLPHERPGWLLLDT